MLISPSDSVKYSMGRAQATPAVLINERAVGTDQSKQFVPLKIAVPRNGAKLR